MSITIAVGEERRTIKDGVWELKDDNLAGFLSTINLVDYKLYTPWPDYTLAEMAAKALGGKIIEATDPPEYVEGRVY